MTSYTSLKRAAKERKSRRRAPGSTLPSSSQPLSSTSGVRKHVKKKAWKRKPVKPIRKVNPEAEAKRRARYRVKLAAYRRSQTYKDVEARAGGQCEAFVSITFGDVFGVSPTPQRGWTRCENTERLSHHHLKYKNFGGAETPEQMLKSCRRCHNWLELLNHPTRKKWWQSHQQGGS